MFKNIRNTIVALLSAATLMAVPVALPVMVSADSISDCLATGTNVDNPSLSSVANGGACTGGTSSTAGANDKINNLVKTVINIFSLIVGIVSVIMIIFGGLKYITSGGESSNVSGAKNTIIYAIIGLVVVALAQFIVQFVLNKVASS